MRLISVVVIAALSASALSFAFPDATSIRVKRQQCRCVRLATGGGMQCSCQQPLTPTDMTGQQGGLASQVSQASGNPHASCHCIQIFLSDNPTYRCMCNPSGTSTTLGVSVITTVPMPTPTVTASLPPVTQPPVYPTPSPFPPITAPPVTAAPPTLPPTYPPTQPPTQPSTLPPITETPTTVTTPSTFAPITIPTVTTPTPLPTPPEITTPGLEPGVTVPSNQQCQCIMIRINGPANAQYSCSCPGVPNPIPVVPGGTGTAVTQMPGQTNPLGPYNDQPTPSPNPFPATGVTNGTNSGCFCLDGPNPNLQCGCNCDCLTLTVTIPSGVCVCPQDENGQVITPTPTQPVTQVTPTYPPVTQPTAVTQPPQTLPPITQPVTYPTQPTSVPTAPTAQTFPPITYPPGVTGAPQTVPTQPHTVYPVTSVPGTVTTPSSDTPSTTLPLTTTCIVYPVSISAQQCNCMPQYEQCAQNVCCLSSRFRSQKADPTLRAQSDADAEESTFDIFVDMLNKIKNKFGSR